MFYILRSLYRATGNISQKHQAIRAIATAKCFLDSTKNYEGDGKTTISILNQDYKNLIMIDSYSVAGFRLNNQIFVVGPMAAFPRTILQWNVRTVEELTPESLSLFSVLEPRLDILVIGTGEKLILPKREVLEFLKRRKIIAEILPTKQACATFNFLNVEGRCVAGAFLPPEEVVMFEEDLKMLRPKEGDNFLM